MIGYVHAESCFSSLAVPAAPAVVQHSSMPLPSLESQHGGGDVLIRVLACGALNVQSYFPVVDIAGKVPGYSVVGVVVEKKHRGLIGGGERNGGWWVEDGTDTLGSVPAPTIFTVNDVVAGVLPLDMNGAMAEYVVTWSSYLLKVPNLPNHIRPPLTNKESTGGQDHGLFDYRRCAASLFYLTMYQYTLKKRLRVDESSVVLFPVPGKLGGVLGLQLATKYFNCRVLAVVDDAEVRRSFVSSFGLPAMDVLLVDTLSDLAGAVSEATGGLGPSHIVLPCCRGSATNEDYDPRSTTVAEASEANFDAFVAEHLLPLCAVGGAVAFIGDAICQGHRRDQQGCSWLRTTELAAARGCSLHFCGSAVLCGLPEHSDLVECMYDSIAMLARRAFDGQRAPAGPREIGLGTGTYSLHPRVAAGLCDISRGAVDAEYLELLRLTESNLGEQGTENTSGAEQGSTKQSHTTGRDLAAEMLLVVPVGYTGSLSRKGKEAFNLPQALLAYGFAALVADHR